MIVVCLFTMTRERRTDLISFRHLVVQVLCNVGCVHDIDEGILITQHLLDLMQI